MDEINEREEIVRLRRRSLRSSVGRLQAAIAYRFGFNGHFSAENAQKTTKTGILLFLTCIF